jgi:hypothetical protein
VDTRNIPVTHCKGRVGRPVLTFTLRDARRLVVSPQERQTWKTASTSSTYGCARTCTGTRARTQTHVRNTEGVPSTWT